MKTRLAPFRKPMPLAIVLHRLIRNFNRNRNDCWIWTGLKDVHGRPKFHGGPRLILADRLAFRIFKGRLPDGVTLRHKCQRTDCINPYHMRMRPVTG